MPLPFRVEPNGEGCEDNREAQSRRAERIDAMNDENFEERIAALSDDELLDVWTSDPDRAGSTHQEKAILAEMERRGNWVLDRLVDSVRH